MKYLIILSVIFLASSCNMQKYIANHPELFPADTIRIETVKIETDSVSYTVPDSLSIELLFECDSNNQVLMRTMDENSSKGVETKITFKDNKLHINAYVDSIAILNKTINTLKNKETTKLNPINTKLESDNKKLQQKNDKLLNKVKKRNKLIYGLLGLIAFLAILYKLFN